MNLEPNRFFAYNGTNKVRVTNPPGGRCSDIFGSVGDTPSPRKIVKDYQKSHVFNGDCADSNGGVVKMTNGLDVTSNDHQERFLSPRHSENTKDRLFGAATNGATPSPRRGVVNDTYRSNVFGSGDDDATSPGARSQTPKKPISIVNPITGDQLMCNGNGDVVSKCNGHSNGVANGHSNGLANGHTNGNVNGYDNGDVANGHENGLAQKNSIRVRAPPGGVSHGIW